MRTITLKTTAASGGHAFAVDDGRRGGPPLDLVLGPSGDGHAVFYRITRVPRDVPLREVLRRFNGTALRRVWEVPFDRLVAGAR